MFAVSVCSSHLTCFYHTVLVGVRESGRKGTSAFCVSWVLLLYSQLRRFKQTVFVFVHTKEGASAGVCVCVSVSKQTRLKGSLHQAGLVREYGGFQCGGENCSDSTMNKLKKACVVNCLSPVTNDLIGACGGCRRRHPSRAVNNWPICTLLSASASCARLIIYTL